MHILPASPENAKPVALYCRVSTEDQAERQTVQVQLDFLRGYAALHALPIAGEYVDDGYSGTIPLDERPGGAQLLEDARRGRFGSVLVYRLDRLGRKLSVLLAAHDALLGLGVAIKSATEPFDTTSPIGTFLFQLLGSLAQLERATISERMTLGRDRLAKQGVYTGGTLPLGYDLDADRRLIPSERPVPGLGLSEAGLVQEMFRRVYEGGSAAGVARWLNACGVPRRARYGTGREVQGSQGKWTVARVADILHCTAYMGEWVLHSRHGTTRRPVPALVSREVWEGVQARLVRNRALAPKNAREYYLLRGLVRCGNCGLSYVGHKSKGKRRYHCAGSCIRVRNDPRYCHGRILPADWLEGVVWGDVRHFLRHPGQALEAARQELGRRQAGLEDAERERRGLMQQVAAKEAERERVLVLYRRGRVTLEEAEGQLEEIDREAASLREMARALEARGELVRATAEWLASTEAMLAELGRRVEAIEALEDANERRRAMRPLVEHLVREVVVTTDLSAPGGQGRARPAVVRVVYAFAPGNAVEFPMV